MREGLSSFFLPYSL